MFSPLLFEKMISVGNHDVAKDLQNAATILTLKQSPGGSLFPLNPKPAHPGKGAGKRRSRA
jgi:hypothetical protein